MIPRILALGLAAYVALATGEASVFEATPCAQECPDDDSSGQCPPTCTYCVCGPHLRAMLAPPGTKPPVTLLSRRVPERTQAPPQSPEPGDILHVPKSPLA